MSGLVAVAPTPDRNFGIDGRLLADVALLDTWPLADTRHGGRLLLFRDEGCWTVLVIRHLTTWREQQPIGGFARVSVTTYPDLDALRAHHQATPHWCPLLQAGAQRDADLRELWRSSDV